MPPLDTRATTSLVRLRDFSRVHEFLVSYSQNKLYVSMLISMSGF